MRLTRTLIVTASTLVVLASEPAFAQILKEKVLAEGASFKLIGSETFPENLEAELYIGSNVFPHFRITGDRNRVDTAAIEVDSRSIISVLFRDKAEEGPILYLFSQNDEREVFALFDLNVDGQWDVKRTPNKEFTSHIFYQDEWLPVDRIDELRSSRPKATRGEKKYEFQGKLWEQSIPNQARP